MKKIIFWIGVNIIGIPEAFVHEIKPHTFQTKSKWFGDQRTNVFLIKQYYL